MYVGDYIASNLGHEVINLFKADNGRHYLYLNSSGNIGAEHADLDVMLLVKGHSSDTFEVIGMARGLHLAPGADATMARDIRKNIPEIARKQHGFIASEPEGITYAGVPLLKIFNDAEQQNIFVTFRADKVFVPVAGVRIFLKYGSDMLEAGPREVTVGLRTHNLPKTSLKSYIYPDGPEEEGMQTSDYQRIKEGIIDNVSIWTDRKEWYPLPDTQRSERRISLFDICRMRDDENRISNAIAYFMSRDAYRPLWVAFFDTLGIRLSKNYTVEREVSASVSDKTWNSDVLPSGGRIDILVEDTDTYVVIENKVKSGINSAAGDGDSVNQLHRYINFAKWKSARSGKTAKFLLISPNYNIPLLDEKTSEVYKIVTFRDICRFLDIPEMRSAFEKDMNFSALYDVMKWHTFDTANEYQYFEMLEKFNERLLAARNARGLSGTLKPEESVMSSEAEPQSRPAAETPTENDIHTLKNIFMAKKSAISGEYIITQEDNNTIRVCQIFDNVKGSLREAAKAVDFEYDPKWNTQQFGSKIVKEFGDGRTATVGEYTITKRDSGSIESYRVHGNTKAALRKIAEEAGLTPNPKWNTRTFGSVLIDYVNGDYNPNQVEEIEAALEVRPDMTVQQLWDAFKEMFGGHLRIKKGNKRYDEHYGTTASEHYDVIDVPLSELGCSGEGRFSPELTVGEFTQRMKDECGLNVTVATSDDWVAVLDDFVLDSISFIPKNTTKAKMQEILER